MSGNINLVNVFHIRRLFSPKQNNIWLYGQAFASFQHGLFMSEEMLDTIILYTLTIIHWTTSTLLTSASSLPVRNKEKMGPYHSLMYWSFQKKMAASTAQSSERPHTLTCTCSGIATTHYHPNIVWLAPYYIEPTPSALNHNCWDRKRITCTRHYPPAITLHGPSTE